MTIDQSVFHSYSNLRHFFANSPAIQEVISRKDKPFTQTLIPEAPNLSWKWTLCQVATFPFRMLLALVLKILYKAAGCLGAENFSQWAKRGFKYQYGGFRFFSEEMTQRFKIKETYNKPNAEGNKIVNIPFIPSDSVLDPRVKKRTFCQLQGGIRLDKKKGYCRGMSDWFVSLYLHTKHHFSDPRRHMAALGRQFVNGGGPEATLLQNLFIHKGKVLNLKIGIQPHHSHLELPTPILEYASANWKASATSIIEQLRNLSSGAYIFRLPHHQIAYIKIDNHLGYIFNAFASSGSSGDSEGLLEINGPDLHTHLYDLVSKVYHDTGGSTEIWDYLSLLPVSLRHPVY